MKKHILRFSVLLGISYLMMEGFDHLHTHDTPLIITTAMSVFVAGLTTAVWHDGERNKLLNLS